MGRKVEKMQNLIHLLEKSEEMGLSGRMIKKQGQCHSFDGNPLGVYLLPRSKSDKILNPKIALH